MHRIGLIVLVCLVVLLGREGEAAVELLRLTDSHANQITGVAADGNGNLFVCGNTTQPAAFRGAIRLGPANTNASASDAFLLKLAPDGTMQNVVLLGGEGTDAAQAIAVDGDGNVVVGGVTYSPRFPQKHPAAGSASGGGGDVFICKFDGTGTNLLFSTVWGGVGAEYLAKLAVDGVGDIVLAGVCGAPDFLTENPTPLASWDPSSAFVAKLAADGSQWRYAFRIGGNEWEFVTGVAADAEGNAYVVGQTTSVDFPLTNAFQSFKPIGTVSGFLMKLAPGGRPIFSTFLAGDHADVPQAVAVNGAGEIVVAGQTFSDVFPLVPAEPYSATVGTGRAFLLKLDTAGTAVVRTNILGFSSSDTFTALGVNAADDVIAAGTVGYMGLPMFVTLKPDGTIETAFGRTACESMASVGAMTIGPAGEVFVSGMERVGNRLASYVARLDSVDLNPSGPQVRLLTPAPKSVIPVRRPFRLEATVVGATGTVSSVSFHVGRRLIGTVTQAPFVLSWTNSGVGVFNLSASAMVDGQLVRSCANRVTVRSPPNDHFARRTRLVGESILVRGDTTTATAEPHEPSSYYYGGSVWYSWQAVRDGAVAVELTPEILSNHFVDVFEGTTLSDLSEVSSRAVSRCVLRVRRGEIYQLRIVGSDSSDGSFELRIHPVDAPINDRFEQALALTGTTVTLKASTWNATSDRRPSNQAGSAGLWYSWKAPATRLYLLSVDGPGGLPYLSVYSGSVRTNLAGIGQQLFGLTNGVALYAQAGMTYRLFVSGGGTNQFTLRIGPLEAPVNDRFANRLTIPSGSLWLTGTLAGATAEVNEPYNFQSSPSVWWTWRPETAGVYAVTVGVVSRPASNDGIPSAPVYFEQARVYSGASVGQLIRVDDATLRYGWPTVFHASPEVDYHIALTGGMAPYSLAIQPVPSPANDAFANASLVSGGLLAVSGTTWGATSETGEPAHGSLSSATDSIWYRWVAPSNGLFSVVSSGAGTVDIYQGDRLTDLTPIAGRGSSHVIRAQAGAEYRLAVADGPRFTLLIRPAHPPANDNFNDRQLISGLHVTFGGSARDATTESNEPVLDYFSANRTVWYSWIAPTNGRYSLRFTSAVYGSSQAAVFVGGALTNLVRVAASSYWSAASFTAETGVAYQIAVNLNYPEFFGTDSDYSAYGLTLFYEPPPRNDRFADRISLTGRAVSLVASNVGGTLEPGEPLNHYSASGSTVWWTWRAPKSGRVTISLEGVANTGPFAGNLGVYTGESLSGLSRLFTEYYGLSAVSVPVEAGEDYQISVDGDSYAASGMFRLRINYQAAPTNDRFANRKPFKSPADGTLAGAFLEPGEPGFDDDPTAASIWWSWTAPADGTYEFSLTSGYYNRLTLFTGDAVDQLVPAATGWQFGSAAMIQATAGTRYAIQVRGYDVGAPITVSLTFRPPPSNDHFTNRLVLLGTNVSFVVTNDTATAEAGEPEHVGEPARKSVWWSWTAPAAGTAVIKLPSSLHRIAVYTGETLESLAAVHEGSEWILFAAEEGQTYQVAIDFIANYEGPAGERFGTLTLHQPPPNDCFTNRIALTGVPTSAMGTTLGATIEAGEATFVNSSGHSVWWKWTAPASARYTFVLPDVPGARLALFTGNELTNLTVLASNRYPLPALNVSIPAGTEIAIAVDLEPSLETENFELRIRQADPPANDEFANRAVVSAGKTTGQLEGSTYEPGEMGYESASEGASIWWSFTPTNSGWYSIVANPSLAAGEYPPFPPSPVPTQDTRVGVGVYSGATLTDLWTAPGRYYFFESYWGSWLTHLEAGTTYAITARGLSGWFGPVTLDILHLPGPANDHFTNAVEISGEHVAVRGNNRLATIEWPEPREALAADNSIWWKWTAPGDGVYALTMTNSPAYTYLKVFTGTAISNLIVVEPVVYGRQGGGHLFRAVGGATYRISAMTGYYEEGWIELALDRANPPANDDFVNRVSLTGANVSLVVSNFDATAESNDPVAGHLGQQTVWWKWQAPASGWTAVNVQPVSYATFRAGVYIGDALGQLTQLAETSYLWPLRFYAVSGVEYSIGVTTWSAFATTFTLSVDGAEAPAAPSFASPLSFGFQPSSEARSVETSTNLIDWAPFSTLAPGQSVVEVLPNQAETSRFFRVR